MDDQDIGKKRTNIMIKLFFLNSECWCLRQSECIFTRKQVILLLLVYDDDL